MTVTTSQYVVRLQNDARTLWRGSRPLLQSLDIELTERCNNNCVHCCINLPAGDNCARRRELPTDRWKEILTEAAALGALSVRFTGGEPLLRPDFPELYLAARTLGLKAVLFTNARLISVSLADLFAHIPPLEPIEVTAYGMKKESYEAVSRVSGSYESFRRGIDLLRRRNVDFMLKGVLLPPNRKELGALDGWSMRVSSTNHVPALSMFFDLRSRRDSKTRNEEIRAVRVSPEEGVAIQSRRHENYRSERHQFCARFLNPSGDRLFDCSFGGKPCVDAYGMLQGCMLLRHPDAVYDLARGSIKDGILDFFPRLRETAAEGADYLSRCGQCFLKGLCEQCPGKSWMEHGTLNTPVDYLCQVAHAEARELGLLKAGENAWQVIDWKERIATPEKNGKS